MKIGILGGTFNPPHIGHLVLARCVKERAGLDKIFFIPTRIPPHKEMFPVEGHHRYAMLKSVLREDAAFEVLDWEIKRAGPSYTIDTLRELRSRRPKDSLYLIIGSELANEFHTWKDTGEIRKIATILVGKRKGMPLLKDAAGFHPVEIIQVAVSSSLVRDWIKEGRSVRYLVPGPVDDYIQKHKLYKKPQKVTKET